jgi:peptidoglycan-N-acetylglucosamine deacetylase
MKPCWMPTAQATEPDLTPQMVRNTMPRRTKLTRNRRVLGSVLWVVIVIGSLAVPSQASAEDMAITFDDLPLNGDLPQGETRTQIVTRVLAILKREGVPPVYGFVNAKRFEGVQDGAEALKAWAAAGEFVGNHTYSHPDLNAVSAESFLADVAVNEPVLELLSRGDEWRWFRYPFLREGDGLDKRRTVRAKLLAAGYRIAHVTIDYEDYLWNSPYARCRARADQAAERWLRSSYLSIASAYLDADRQMAQLVFGRQISHVLLLHLGAFSENILPDLLQLLRDKGFRLVTLDEAQKDAAYQSDPDAPSRYGGTLLEQWLDARKIKYPAAPPKPYKALENACR